MNSVTAVLMGSVDMVDEQSRDVDEQQKLTKQFPENDQQRYMSNVQQRNDISVDNDVLTVVRGDPCEHILEQQVGQVDDNEQLN